MITHCTLSPVLASQLSSHLHEEAQQFIQDFLRSDFSWQLHDTLCYTHLQISFDGQKLILHFSQPETHQENTHLISLSPYKATLEEYQLIRHAHHENLAGGNSMQLETLDMARRGVHNQGATLLQKRLQHKMILDLTAARFLFSILAIIYEGI